MDKKNDHNKEAEQQACLDRLRTGEEEGRLLLILRHPLFAFHDFFAVIFAERKGHKSSTKEGT